MPPRMEGYSDSGLTDRSILANLLLPILLDVSWITELLVDVEALYTAPGGLDHHVDLRSCFLRSWSDVKPPAAQTHEDLCASVERRSSTCVGNLAGSDRSSQASPGLPQSMRSGASADLK